VSDSVSVSDSESVSDSAWDSESVSESRLGYSACQVASMLLPSGSSTNAP